ncbi:hypothetical protein AB0J63_46895 [Streptosporangium canum]|uniref:hypothetical protein n=1 Tax=Streptosporangium canum TaxID=324952 RepID=UPI00342DAD93
MAEVGADHIDTLSSRYWHAYFAGQAGDAAEAARLRTQLAADQERVLGADHADTLRARDWGCR